MGGGEANEQKIVFIMLCWSHGPLSFGDSGWRRREGDALLPAKAPFSHCHGTLQQHSSGQICLSVEAADGPPSVMRDLPGPRGGTGPINAPVNCAGLCTPFPWPRIILPERGGWSDRDRCAKPNQAIGARVLHRPSAERSLLDPCTA